MSLRLRRVPLLTATALASLLATGCAAPGPAAFTDRPAVVLAPVAAAGIQDGRAAFRARFCEALARDPAHAGGDCVTWLHRLADEPDSPAGTNDTAAPTPSVDLLLVPGVFGECVQDSVGLFADAIPRLEKLGYHVSVVPVRGRAGSGHNAGIIRDHVLAHAARHSGRRVLFIAYSKGVPDVLTAIDAYPEIRPHTAGLVSIAGAVNGTPLADEWQATYEALTDGLPLARCPEIDGKALHSLTRQERLAWLARHPLPEGLRYYSLVALPTPDRISAVLRGAYLRLATIDPGNDSQLIHHDAILPGSTLLGYANADHWAIALPFGEAMPGLAAWLVTRNDFPRRALLEAAVAFAEADLRRGGRP